MDFISFPLRYIETPSVRKNMKNVVRVISIGGGVPLLIQGDTSVGKTSLITYIARKVIPALEFS